MKKEIRQAKGNMDQIYEIYNTPGEIVDQEFSKFQIEHFKLVKIFLYISYLFDIITKSFSCEISKKLDFFIGMMLILGFHFILIIASLFFLRQYSTKNRLDRLLGNFAILMQAYFLVYCLVYSNDVFIETKLRGFFSMFFFSLAEILFSYEVNLLNNILILLLNAAVSVLLCVLGYKKNQNPINFIYQIAVLGNLILVIAFTFKIKNGDFIEQHVKKHMRLNWCEKYADDYMNSLNSFFFILKNNKVKKVNERFIDYLFSLFGFDRDKGLISPKNNYIQGNERNENELKKEINNLSGNIESDSDKRKNEERTEIEKHLFLKSSSEPNAKDKDTICSDVPQEEISSLSKKFLKLLKPLKINQDFFSAANSSEENLIKQNLSRYFCSHDYSIRNNKNKLEFRLNADLFSGNAEANLFSILSCLKYNFNSLDEENNLASKHSDFIYLGDFTKEKLDPLNDKSFYEAFEAKIKNLAKNKDANLIVNSSNLNNYYNYKKIEKENLVIENAKAEAQGSDFYLTTSPPQNKVLDDLEKKKRLFLKDNDVSLSRKHFQVFLRVYTSKNKEIEGDTNAAESQTCIEILLNDITDLKQSQEIEFILKAKFFAKLAHEFKTPLNGILGLIKKIQHEHEDEGLKNFLNKKVKNDLFQIENLSNYVLFLINDIIEYSNIHNQNYRARSFRNSNSKKIFEPELNDANELNHNNNINSNYTKNININRPNSAFSSKIKNDFTDTDKNNRTNLNNDNVDDKNKESSKENCNENYFNFNSLIKKNKPCEFIRNNETQKSSFIVNVNLEKINLKEILNFCRDVTNTLLISRGKEKSVKTKIEFDNDINSLNILSDCFRVKQILLNFLSNAVKFTKKGEITIKAAVAAVYRCNVKIAISIIDSGIGIKKEELDLIFKENLMLTAAKECNFMGTGLGLSIARNIAAKLNHEIEVSSDYGKGSEFRLVLYCAREKENNLLLEKIKNPKASKRIRGDKEDNASSANTLNLPNKPFNKCNLLSILNSSRSIENREKSERNFVNRSDEDMYKRNIVFEDEKNSSPEENENPENKQKFITENDDNNRMVIQEIADVKEKDDILICNENIENQIICKSNAIKKSKQNDLNKLIDEAPNDCFRERTPKCFDVNSANKFSNKKLNKKFYRENINFELSSSSSEEKGSELKRFSNFNSNDNLNLSSKNNNLQINPNNNSNANSNNSNSKAVLRSKIYNDNYDDDLIYDKVYKNISRQNNYYSSNNNGLNAINNNPQSNQASEKNRVFTNDFGSSNVSFYRKSPETSSILGDSEKTVVVDDSEIFRFDFDNSKNLFEEIEKIRSNNQSIFLGAINNFNINCNNSENNNIKISLNSNCTSANNKMDTRICEQNTNHRTYLNYNSDNNSNFYFSRMKNSLKFDEDFNGDLSNNCALQKLNSTSCERARKKLSKFSEKKQSAEKSKKNKILIADDQKFIRSALRYSVEKVLKDAKKNSDFEVLECSDGIDVLNEIIQDQSMNNTIRCVLTDENMEYLNGSTTVKILRDMQHSNKIKSLPIACLTAYEDSFNKELIYKAGVDLILSKPCTEKSVMKFFEDFKVLQS